MSTLDQPRTPPLRRHLRWAIPLVAGAAGYLVFTPIGAAIVNADGEPDVGASLLALACFALALLIPAAGLVLFLVNGARTLGEWRRFRRHAAGRFTKVEQSEIAHSASLAAAWHDAKTVRASLLRRETPPAVHVWDVVANANETFFYDVPAGYARFYGQDVTYSQSGGFFFGHPLFVAAGLTLSAVGNAARRSQAEAAAHTQWRDQQPVRMLVSNQRIVCHANGQWLSFYYSAMSAVYPEIGQWTLICQFDSTSPLLLHGPAVPAAALLTVLATHGPHAVEHHPSLTALND